MSNLVRNPGSIQERIVGFEMEYCPSITYDFFLEGISDGIRYIDFPDASIIRAIYKQYGALPGDTFLANGFRAYLDLSMVELCTPEVAPDVVGVCQLASEEMVLKALKHVRQHALEHEFVFDESTAMSDHYLLPLRAEGLGADSSRGTETSGFHENYQWLASDLRFNKLTQAFLDIYLTTQSSWTGQGIVQPGSQFHYAQKRESISHGVSESHMLHPAGPGCESANGKRLELRRANYPLLHWQLVHRAAFTSAVLRSVESGELPLQQFLDHAANLRMPQENTSAIGVFTLDESLRIQRRLTDIIANYAHRDGYPDYEVDAIEQVATVMERLQQEGPDAVIDQVTWARKKWLLDKKLPEFEDAPAKVDKKSNASLVVKASQIDVAHDSRGKHGLADIMRREAGKIIPYEDVAVAEVDPPAVDVAKKRAENIREQLKLPNPRGERRLLRGRWMTSQLVLVDYEQPVGPPTSTLVGS